jgi:hypothetical protein
VKDSSLVPFYRNPATPLVKCKVCGISGDDRPVPPTSTFPAMCTPCRIRHDLARMAEADPMNPTPQVDCVPFLDSSILDLDVDTWVTTQLAAIGLAKEEIAAKLNLITPEILTSIPSACLGRIKVGGVPSTGFGLAGLAGAGKTMAVAGLTRLLLTNNLRATAPLKGLRSVTQVKWVSWPTTVTRWRLDALDDTIALQVDRLASVKLLILDDLGREPRKDYAEDRVAGILDLIIAERDRADLPIVWTSNLGEAELIERYGSSAFRRLTRINPAIRPEGLRLFEVSNG